MRYKLGDTQGFEQFKYLIDNRYFIFRAILFNADSAVTLNQGAIRELCLKDNIFNFYTDGYIVIENTDDVLERYVTDNSSAELQNQVVKDFGFKVRGDGRDILYLTIIPLNNGNEPFDLNPTDNRLFGFNCYYVLHNETNLPSEEGKLKRYDIVDIDYQILSERKIFFTTSDLVKNIDVSQTSDAQREAFTGDCIKKILIDTLEDNNVVRVENNTTPDFDSGIFKLFYSSPAGTSAMENIEYLLQHHVCSDGSNDFPIFKKDHFTGEFILKSTSELFKNAYIRKGELDAGGSEFIENFNITGAQDDNVISVNDIKKPNLTLELGEQSDVLEVNFYNVPADLYTERVQTRVVHSYDFSDKKFIINGVDGDIENVKNVFTSNYVSPLKGKDNRPYPSFINNTAKRTNQNYKDVFTIYPEPLNILNAGRNKALYNALMLNMGVEITVKGNFGRGSGKFISIDRRGSYIDNEFDNKFLGIYYVIDVEHTMKDNVFYDKITAVKTYHYTDPKINENV